jgi:hypothetical protein
MEALHSAFENAMLQLAKSIQDSEELATYVEEEDEITYKALQEAYEPSIAAIYDQVASEYPLQLLSLEKLLLNQDFEGLFLPKILGYSVLRPHKNNNFKYAVPQNHFKDILLNICNSPNFEQIRKRIGQTTQIGFALSSDIWITSLIDSLENKKIKQFLLGQKIDVLRDEVKRAEAFEKYKKQFTNVNYHTTDFPDTEIQLVNNYPSLKEFLLFRSTGALDNDSMMPHVGKLISNPALKGAEYMDLMIIIGLKYQLTDQMAADYSAKMKSLLVNDKDIALFFDLYDETLLQLKVSNEDELRITKLLSGIEATEMKSYFKTTTILHTAGFVSPDTIDAIRLFYEGHKGLSKENECIRTMVLQYVAHVFDHLDETQYLEYFELHRNINYYIEIFANEKFNQDVKEISLRYANRCFEYYSDKRSKDYQDIKKFVTSTYIELGFFTDKQMKEMFKTKRKVADK